MLALATSSASAASLAISLGIRETNNPSGTAIFSNAGTSNGIEFVNLDGQSLVADGTWQQFTFTPAVDTLTAFAGATANGILEAGLEIAALEHIRIRNVDGITQPIRVWVDDVTNAVAAGPVVESFEGHALGAEVMFQEPGFSGSTSANLVAGSTAAVTDSMANTGGQSYQTDFQFVDNDPTRWVRLTTFASGNPLNPPLGNPAIRVREVTGAPVTISFYAKAQVIPEPATLTLAALGMIGLLAARRRSL
jgi:hypothetical protein